MRAIKTKHERDNNNVFTNILEAMNKYRNIKLPKQAFEFFVKVFTCLVLNAATLLQVVAGTEPVI